MNKKNSYYRFWFSVQLIARRVRELNIYSIILPHDLKDSHVDFSKLKVLFYQVGLNVIQKILKLNKS